MFTFLCTHKKESVSVAELNHQLFALKPRVRSFLISHAALLLPFPQNIFKEPGSLSMATITKLRAACRAHITAEEPWPAPLMLQTFQTFALFCYYYYCLFFLKNLIAETVLYLIIMIHYDLCDSDEYRYEVRLQGTRTYDPALHHSKKPGSWALYSHVYDTKMDHAVGPSRASPLRRRHESLKTTSLSSQSLYRYINLHISPDRPFWALSDRHDCC